MKQALEVAKKKNNILQDDRHVYGLAWEAIFALHAYRASISSSTTATPYSLVCGMEVVLHIEVEKSLHYVIFMETELKEV